LISNSLGFLIEEPLLTLGVLSPSSNPDITGSVALGNSLHWKSGSNIEWPIDIESELFIKSLGFSLCLLVKIEDLPSLVSSVMSVMNLDLLSFNIFTLEYIEASVGLLDVTEVFTTVDKDLEPSRVG
jgi:hypothetical protein